MVVDQSSDDSHMKLKLMSKPISHRMTFLSFSSFFIDPYV